MLPRGRRALLLLANLRTVLAVFEECDISSNRDAIRAPMRARAQGDARELADTTEVLARKQRPYDLEASSPGASRKG